MADRGGGRGGGGRGGGRGAFYKARYGGGRGRARGSGFDSGGQQRHEPEYEDFGSDQQAKGDWNALSNKLHNLDGGPYGAYKSLRGLWTCSSPRFTLRFDRIQSDSYASPTTVSALVPFDVAKFPSKYTESPIRRVALADFLTRLTADSIRNMGMDQANDGGGWAAPKGGDFNINAPGQEILERTSCIVRSDEAIVELRFTVSLPAKGRTILGKQAHNILCQNLPQLLSQNLLYDNLPKARLQKHVDVAEEQEVLRSQLDDRGLIAFIANGAVLPRASGGGSLPLNSTKLVSFRSSPEFEVEFHGLKAKVKGMGIPKGVTVLTGGGYHGKSTLLEAVQLGVYNHVPGDGREGVVTNRTAFKIRAEDGRRVSGLDITPFISKLPGGKDTENFSTQDASGSTSMASNIQEALEIGSRLLLIDEDSSATNLLVRDVRMQELIKAEPITPFVGKARALFEQHGVSTVIVIGGCGDYLTVADSVIAMEEYLPHDYTAAAKRIVAKYPTSIEQHQTYGNIPRRFVGLPRNAVGTKPPKVQGMSFIHTREKPANPVRDPSEEESGVDVSALEQLVERGQIVFISQYLRYVAERKISGPLVDVLDSLQKGLSEQGMDIIHVEGFMVGDLVAVRALELGAALNRVRRLMVEGALSDNSDTAMQ